MLAKRVFCFIVFAMITACTSESYTMQNTRDEGLDDRRQTNFQAKCWSVNGKLIAGNNDRQVGMQAVFNEPGSYTVSFGAAFPQNVHTLLQAEATIRWSVAGNTITRKVTVGNGVSITGNAEGVSVTISDVSVTATGDEYDVVATVTKGVRGSVEMLPVLLPPQSTGRGVAIAAGATFDVAVPVSSGAIAVNVTVGEFTGALLPLNTMNIQQKIGNTIQRTYDPRDAGEWVPLIYNATTVRFTNNGAVPVTVYVSFGVDG